MDNIAEEIAEEIRTTIPYPIWDERCGDFPKSEEREFLNDVKAAINRRIAPLKANLEDAQQEIADLKNERKEWLAAKIPEVADAVRIKMLDSYCIYDNGDYAEDELECNMILAHPVVLTENITAALLTKFGITDEK